ncbi:MAG: hypothetical protein WC788_07685 [Candidatus Paceibacterota bacterium]|jgi:hypothetical protein
MDIKKGVIAVLIISIISISGNLSWRIFSGPTTLRLSSSSPLLLIIDDSLEQNARDDQRVRDILLLSEKIFASNTKLGGYAFVASEWQNISVEENPLVLELENNGYIEMALKDPQPDKYYSYRSDGYTYELRAVLENKNSGKCEVLEDQCFYTVKKEMISPPVEDNSLDSTEYDGGLF